MSEREPTVEEWAATVAFVLAEHPEWMAVTVNAVQKGVLTAQERLRERIAEVSLGLYEALNTKPHYVRRRHEFIIGGIKASNMHPSVWSAAAIEKEGGDV
jgi:hypothetical protein